MQVIAIICAMIMWVVLFAGAIFMTLYEEEKRKKDYFFNQSKKEHEKIAKEVAEEIKQKKEHDKYVEENRDDLETLYMLQKKYL